MSLRVLDAGWSSTVQDLGRVGWAHLGVGRAGAMDRRAASLANRLVGNGDGAAVLETTGGLRLVAQGATLLAVTGARVTVNAAGREQALDAPLTLADGAELTLGVPSRGQGRWAYVAVRGGVAVTPVLGSRSWDSLGALGPEPLVSGRVLPVGPDPGGAVVVEVAPVAPFVDHLVVRVWPGPRPMAFVPDAWRLLITQKWMVDSRSDRVGTVLSGPSLPRVYHDDLPSEALVTGAVQVPSDGRPIVMMRDHPTTGGYPVIAIVDPRDLDALAQRQPGDEVRMVPVNTGRTALGSGRGSDAP